MAFKVGREGGFNLMAKRLKGDDQGSNVVHRARPSPKGGGIMGSGGPSTGGAFGLGRRVGGVATPAQLGVGSVRGGLPLSMYETAPDFNISLEDFRLWAVERLTVLKSIEMAVSMGKKPEEVDELALKMMKKHLDDRTSTLKPTIGWAEVGLSRDAVTPEAKGKQQVSSPLGKDGAAAGVKREREEEEYGEGDMDMGEGFDGGMPGRRDLSMDESWGRGGGGGGGAGPSGGPKADSAGLTKRLQSGEGALWEEGGELPYGSKDWGSHYIMRLAYCRNEELRRWMIAQEVVLFRARFQAQGLKAQAEFMAHYKLPYEPIDRHEASEVHDDLMKVNRATNSKESLAYYKVPFHEVPDLVRGRRVLVRAGYAYVPAENLVSIVVGHYRQQLSKAMTLTGRYWNMRLREEEMDRLTPLVESISTAYVGKDYGKGGGKSSGVILRLADLHPVALESFPPCMLNLYQAVKMENHLRNAGRMQLGLFLKGAGMPMEESLDFFRSEFSKKMGADKFDKEYAYNVRHIYGKEGARKDYTAMSCMKIIMGPAPGQSEHHGCPFKTFGPDRLKSFVAATGVKDPTAVSAIVDKASRQQNYQIACMMYFEGKHGKAPEPVNHPNGYFEDSRKALGASDPEPKALPAPAADGEGQLTPAKRPAEAEASVATPE